MAVRVDEHAGGRPGPRIRRDHALLQAHAREFGPGSAWLLAPSGPPPANAPSAAEVDGVAALLFDSWVVLPAVLPRFLAWIGANHRARASVAALAARALAVAYLARTQVAALRHAARVLEARGIDHVLLKGAATRLLCYTDPFDRCGLDVDIGVHKAQAPAARAALETIGFEAAQWNPATYRFERADPVLRAYVEAGHYELGFLVRRQRVVDLPPAAVAAIEAQLDHEPSLWHRGADGQLACYVNFDVHHGISLEIPTQPILATRRLIERAGERWWVPRPAWAMLHLIFKLYWEGVHAYSEGAYQYADVCRLAPLLDADEVGALRESLTHWRLRAAAHFVLRRLPTVFGVTLSAPLAQLVEECGRPAPGSRPKDDNDHGDVWPKLWGMR